MRGIALAAQILDYLLDIEWELDFIRFYFRVREGVMQVSERAPCRAAR
jgi:hypothetical protein